LFGRDARTSAGLVELLEEGGEFLEHGVHLALDGPQRMMGWDGGVEVQDGEEVGLSLRFAAHISADLRTL
jgi:hypothetical protein